MAVAVSSSSLLHKISTYDGHLVFPSRTGGGKTTLMLAAIAYISETTSAEFFCASGKKSNWMGLEKQIAKDNQPRVINVSLTNPASIEPLMHRLRWAVAIQESREDIRIEKTELGEAINPRPFYFIFDEWLIILKVAKKHGAKTYAELIDLVEALVYKGRQDKCYIWLFAQGHQCGTLHLDGDLRRNLGIVSPAGGGNYQSITAAINDSDLVEDATERDRLRLQYQQLLTENPQQRIYYTSIGGHSLEAMETLPDMEQQRIFSSTAQERTKLEQLYKNSPSAPQPPESNTQPPTTEPSPTLQEREVAVKEQELKLKLRQYQDTVATAESRWNLITLAYCTTVFAIYLFPPFSGTLQGLWRGAVKTGQAVANVVTGVNNTVNYWAPNLQRPPIVGQTIAGHKITSISSNGAQVAGNVSLYAIGKPGESIDVRCNGGTATFTATGFTFTYSGLSHCANGKHKVGGIIAKGSNPVISQSKINGEVTTPFTGYVWWAVTGDAPAPLFTGASTSGVKVAEIASQWKNKEFKPGQTARCADFVRHVLKQAGVDVGVSSSPWDKGKQPNNGPLMARSFFGNDIGTPIDPKNIQPGDIIGFTNTYGSWSQGAITHVGIAVSPTEMVDRPTANVPVKHRSIFNTFPNSQVFVVRPNAYK